MKSRLASLHMRKVPAVFLTLALSAAPFVAPAAVSSASDAEQITTAITDTSRLVAIGGSLTEIIFALGEEDRLTARDSTSVYPPEAMKLPDVGYMRRLSPEGVLSVSPSGIIALESSGPPETLDVLEKASVPIVLVPEDFNRDSIIEKIKTIGAILQVPAKAEALAEQVEADIRAAEDATAGVTDRKRVLFILSLQSGRVLASGSGTAADGIIAMAGGINAVTGYEGYKQLTDEAIIEAKPDMILMMDRSGGLDIAEEELFSHPAIAATPAGANRRMAKMDGAYLLGFGPRTANAVRDLSRALYGDQISY